MLGPLYCDKYASVRINAGHHKGRAMAACDDHVAAVAKAVAKDKKLAIISIMDDKRMPCDWGRGLPWIVEKRNG